METKLKLLWGAAILALAMTAVLGAGPAGAKPRPAFAPKIGGYAGDSFAEGKTHSVSAVVKKKGSKYSAEVEIVVPAKCTDAETGFTAPTELTYKVTALVKGQTISFKGDSVDEMQIVGYQVPSGITLNGRFTKPTAFAATASVQAPATGAQSGISCVVPAAKLKFEFALAA